MTAAKTSKLPRRRIALREPEELTARILRFRESYILSRSDPSNSAFIDDEAMLTIEGKIERVSPRQARHEGKPLQLTLLHAERYSGSEDRNVSFFGSVTLRGETRGALAYLPKDSFWALPGLIERGATWVQLRFAAQHRGWAELLSICIGHGEDFPDAATGG